MIRNLPPVYLSVALLSVVLQFNLEKIKPDFVKLLVEIEPELWFELKVQETSRIRTVNRLSGFGN